ncbi:NHL repeat-containing protein [Variovorax boronicumulans]|uniref:NHL repeat-containing protein n=1 Tax=Variovorax boronicumulans TaxID=436515 RepID=UPI00339118B7
MLTVGGNVSGLAVHGRLVLQNNAGDDLRITANGPFNFPTPVAQGATYAVTVATQPAWQLCTVTNGAGTANAAVSNITVECTQARVEVTTFAGSGAFGSIDGTGTAASFAYPAGVAADAGGNLYVADAFGHTIRKITPAGEVTTLAGSGAKGSANGNGIAASFAHPSGVAVDAHGNVYVADNNNHAIRKITPAGEVSTLAGSGAEGSANGNGTAASFDHPHGVAVDAHGNVYVADRGNNAIRKISPAGEVTTLAGSGAPGSADGTGTAASFNRPGAVAADANGNVYVADTGNRIVRKISPAGEVTTLAGSGVQGSTNGNGAAASFDALTAIALDTSGNLYVGDENSNLIRMISPSGDVTTLAGSGAAGSTNGSGTNASFSGPLGIAIDGNGNLYVADVNNNMIRKLASVAP